MRGKYLTFVFCLILVTGLTSVAHAQTHVSKICNPECMNAITTSSASHSRTPLSFQPPIVCPSGVGQVVCELVFDDPDDISIILELCERGLLDPQICQSLNAQSTVIQLTATCPLVVNYNLARAARGCADLDRNEACYGSGQAVSIPSELFTEPVEIVDLPPVIAIEVGGYSLNAAQYSFSLLNSDADLHIGVDGGLRILMFNGVRVENAVTQAEAVLLPEEAVEVSLQETAALFDSPSEAGKQTIIAEITTGDILLVDAVSADEEWARVLYSTETPFGENPNAWVSTDAVMFPEDVIPDELPRMEVDDHTPMHSFYFLPNSVPVPECTPVLGDTLLLQAPRDIETTFVANDARVLITDTVALHYANSDDDLELRVVNGIAVINPGTELAEVIAPGYGVRIELADQRQNLGADGIANDYTLAADAQWDEPFELPLALIENMAAFETLPPELLNQPIDAPRCGSETQGQDCDIEYDSDQDAALVAKLCNEGLLSDELEICSE